MYQQIDSILEKYHRKIERIGNQSVYTMDSDPADEKAALKDQAAELIADLLEQDAVKLMDEYVTFEDITHEHCLAVAIELLEE